MITQSPSFTVLSESINVNNTDLGWKIYGGFNVNKYLAVELSYIDLGELSFDGSISQEYISTVSQFTYDTTFNLKMDISGFTVAGIAKYPLLENLDVFAKFGGIHWDSHTIPKANTEVTNVQAFSTFVTGGFASIGSIPIYFSNPPFTPFPVTSVSPQQSFNDSGTDMIIGLGLNYKLKNNIGVRAEWERFQNISFDGKDIDFFNFGLNYNFDLF